MTPRAAFALAYRAVRISHPHATGSATAGHGRQVHPFHVEALVYAAASAVAGKRLVPDHRLRIDHDFPLAYLQRAHADVRRAYEWKVALARGEVRSGYAEDRLRGIERAVKDAWSRVSFLRRTRGVDDLWNLRHDCRDDPALVRRAWAEMRAGTEGPALTAVRLLRTNHDLTVAHAVAIAEGVLAPRGAA